MGISYQLSAISFAKQIWPLPPKSRFPSTSLRAGSRLRKIVRFANDLSSLGMTGLSLIDDSDVAYTGTGTESTIS